MSRRLVLHIQLCRQRLISFFLQCLQIYQWTTNMSCWCYSILLLSFTLWCLGGCSFLSIVKCLQRLSSFEDLFSRKGRRKALPDKRILTLHLNVFLILILILDVVVYLSTRICQLVCYLSSCCWLLSSRIYSSLHLIDLIFIVAHFTPIRGLSLRHLLQIF